MEINQKIEKAVSKLKSRKHIGGKDACLHFILPLIHQMHSEYSEAFQSLSEDLDSVYETLGIGETGFIDDAVEFVQQYNGFVDKVLAAAGFFEADPDKAGTFRLSPSMPSELKEELSAQQARMVAFLQQLENLRLDDDEEEDEEEEGPDVEGDTDSLEDETLLGDPSSPSLADGESVEASEVIPPPEVLPSDSPSTDQGATHA